MPHPTQAGLPGHLLRIAALAALATAYPLVTVAALPAETGAAESFKGLDANGDGYATAEEASAAHIGAEDFAAADRNRDGRLDVEEYLAAGLAPAAGKATP